MKSFTSRRFRDMYAQLPQDAKRAYQLFRRNPALPGLNFKKVDALDNIHSARVGLGYRALAKVDDDDVVWLWIARTPGTIGCSVRDAWVWL